MGKRFNVKSGSTQLSQEVASDQAAQEQREQQQELQRQAEVELQESGVKSVADLVNVEEGAGPTDVEEGAAGTRQDVVIEPVAAPQVRKAPELPKAAVVEAAKPVAAQGALKDELAQILKDVPAAYQTDVARIVNYVERMAPKRPIDAKAMLSEQVALYRSIQNIINRQEQYFTQLFSAVLFLFKSEGKTGALSDRYRMRGMDNVALHAGDRKAFAALTQMLHILADTASRDLAMKQINMDKALENGLTADGKKRVLHYFGV